MGRYGSKVSTSPRSKFISGGSAFRCKTKTLKEWRWNERPRLVGTTKKRRPWSSRINRWPLSVQSKCVGDHVDGTYPEPIKNPNAQRFCKKTPQDFPFRTACASHDTHHISIPSSPVHFRSDRHLSSSTPYLKQNVPKEREMKNDDFISPRLHFAFPA